MIPSLQYLDRYRNEGTRTYSKHSAYTEAKELYRPNASQKNFIVNAFAIPRQDLLIYTANPPQELSVSYLGKEKALFCIHPQVLEEYTTDPYVQAVIKTSKSRRKIEVIPSSSTRTLYVKSAFPHAIKLHFPFRVSRYNRKMRDEVIEQAVNVSRDMEYGIDNFDPTFAYLREVIGISYANLNTSSSRGENWGYLIRDMRPFPVCREKRALIPGFALYGKDFFTAEQAPLLYSLIDAADPVEFILGRIMLPIIHHWVQCFSTFGYMLEPHGQNVLLELDDEQNITRIVHRDLSVGIDMRRRQDLQISSTHLNQYNRMDYGQFLSIAYDMFMGSHFFDRIVACCREKFPGLTDEDFRKPCRQTFEKIFPEHRKYFPATIHYFSEQRDRYNKPLYKDTGKKPQWRP
ncbi:IucA/IucC family protein [Desulfogranum marinum]|uniref:IucA/IucC family protein n=1 Tax=Desulfogranum marinum TaxID=453220 RepID=UPI001962DE33|nr:IucA/IucC family protein [Desulfogranum marinum]MBM9514453.1 hypothetical protein [Desulfogranum marinum]